MTRRTSSSATPQTVRQGSVSCNHRWLLGTPNGPKVLGRCRACGTQRDFPTTAEDLWYGEPWSSARTRERDARAGADTN